MDPLSAIALAGDVLQFIEFTSKLLSTSVEVYQSTAGTLNANLISLEEICKQLCDLSNCLRESSSSARSSPTQSALREIADECNNDCICLLIKQNNLKASDENYRRWKSF
ncbi:hypothetical protein F5Y11DRAFT_337799 [Daldinia sp. FL1419]|nr:hypothetical protein F5Y11DRAFT_337799 [Daldinia sp. FL1419]